MAEIVKNDPEPKRAKKKVNYLSVCNTYLQGTKHFKGSNDLIEVDEWKSRLIRNFESTRCPDDYKKNIMVHFLEKDAHNWWLAVDKRTSGRVERIKDFEYEFNLKYFPAEAKFMYLTQGRKTVHEYEEEFNRLMCYVHKELYHKKVQLHRLFYCVRVELRTHCSVLTFYYLGAG